MIRLALILAEGFEEVEALTPVDLLRRAGIGCDMVSLSAATASGSWRTPRGTRRTSALMTA